MAEREITTCEPSEAVTLVVTASETMTAEISLWASFPGVGWALVFEWLGTLEAGPVVAAIASVPGAVGWRATSRDGRGKSDPRIELFPRSCAAFSGLQILLPNAPEILVP